MRVLLVSLVVAVVVLADRGAAPQLTLTGTVVEIQSGEWLSVRNDQTDETGTRIALRETTAYHPAALRPGVRVTVWYKSIGERRPVADKVRVLTGGTPPGR